MSSEVVLRTDRIVKHFGQTYALNGISVELCKGDIIGLIGENGSGKSTLASIISGVYPPTSGSLELKGQAYKPTDPLDAQRHGVSMVTQEMGTLSGIRVADNIFLGRGDRFTTYGIVNRKAMYQAAKQAMKDIGITDIIPEAPIANYSLEERKLIEVVRAVYNNPEIFIVDETTTALSQKGRDIIYKLVEKFRDENKTTVFISHDLQEIMRVCNKLIVLRDGDFIRQLDQSEFDEELIKELMVGRKLTGSYYRKDYDGSYGSEVVLKAEGIHKVNTLNNVSLELHRGEILGIGGLTDCGMHDLGKVLFGLEKPLMGKVTLKDGVLVTSPEVSIAHKVGYVSKNRDEEALILSASIMDNIVLPSLPMISKKGLVFKTSEKKFTRTQVKNMSIKCRRIDQDVRELSGGNKQKVVFGKWLGNQSDLFILDCPTRGIDIGVKAFMYQLMYKFKQEGKSIIMISEELTELIGMSDRILIMKDGTIRKEFKRSADLTESELIREMV